MLLIVKFAIHVMTFPYQELSIALNCQNMFCKLSSVTESFIFIFKSLLPSNTGVMNPTYYWT